MWEGDEDGEPLRGLVMSGCHELDSCRCINERAVRFFTEGVDVRWEWPTLHDAAMAPVSGNLRETRPEEELDVGVHQRAFDLMEFQDLCDGSEGCQTKSGTNPWLEPPRDKELDVRYTVHITGENRQDCGGGFVALTLVEGIDDDQSRDIDGIERTDDELLHLRTEVFLPHIRVGPQDLKKLLPNRRITVGKLEGESWKYCLKVTPVLEALRAEEAGPKPPVREAHLGERLGDG